MHGLSHTEQTLVPQPVHFERLLTALIPPAGGDHSALPAGWTRRDKRMGARHRSGVYWQQRLQRGGQPPSCSGSTAAAESHPCSCVDGRASVSWDWIDPPGVHRSLLAILRLVIVLCVQRWEAEVDKSLCRMTSQC